MFPAVITFVPVVCSRPMASHATKPRAIQQNVQENPEDGKVLRGAPGAGELRRTHLQGQVSQLCFRCQANTLSGPNSEVRTGHVGAHEIRLWLLLCDPYIDQCPLDGDVLGHQGAGVHDGNIHGRRSSLKRPPALRREVARVHVLDRGPVQSRENQRSVRAHLLDLKTLCAASPQGQ